MQSEAGKMSCNSYYNFLTLAINVPKVGFKKITENEKAGYV